MDKDYNIYLINQDIKKKIVESSRLVYNINFSDYKKVEQILANHQPQTIKIYDTTTAETNRPIIHVNDHINRIGNNPFIGKQQQFNIDFINIESLYIQNKNGVVTDSCGDKTPVGRYPSTHLANIAIMCHVFKYKVNAFLVHR